MADYEDPNPLIPKKQQQEEKEKEKEGDEKKSSKNHPIPPPPPHAVGWAAHGLAVGEPMPPMIHRRITTNNDDNDNNYRSEWNSSIFSCLGTKDQFCGSDLEVCLLGSLVPCVLYGSNIERLGSVPGTFANHCMPYTGLYILGNCFFGWNCLAPWLSYPIRTAIRRKFNLEGSCEATVRSGGLCGNVMEDEVQREQCESACDLATHVFCHPCALCQEGREIRRRLTHPGFNTHPVVLMMPPGGQTMGREV